MLPLLHAGWRRGRAVASGLRHPYQVRRLRSVFGSGRACRNSCDFRTAVIPAARRGAGRPAQPTRDSRHSPPGHPRLYRSRQAPAIAPVTSRPSRPRHRLTRLLSRPAHKPHLSPTLSRTRHPQLARAAPRIPAPDPLERHEPRIHCVPTPWIPRFTSSGALRPASGSRPPRHPLRATHPCETRVPTERTPNPNANRAQPPNSRQTFSHSQ